MSVIEEELRFKKTTLKSAIKVEEELYDAVLLLSDAINKIQEWSVKYGDSQPMINIVGALASQLFIEEVAWKKKSQFVRDMKSELNILTGETNE